MKMFNSLLAVAVLCIGFGAHAQKNQRESISFGIKGGINYASVWDSQGEDFAANPKVGGAGGAFLAIPIGKYLGIQPEVLYSQKGFTGSGVLAGSRYNVTRTTNYLDIPILIQLKPIDYLTIVAGPNYSYLMSQKDRVTYGSSSVEQEQEFANDDIRRNTLGFIGGVDLNVRSFVIGARAGWDFQNNTPSSSGTPRYKNQWLQLTLGLRF